MSRLFKVIGCVVGFFIAAYTGALLTATVATVVAPIAVYIFPPRLPNQAKGKIRVALTTSVAELKEGAAARFEKHVLESVDAVVATSKADADHFDRVAPLNLGQSHSPDVARADLDAVRDQQRPLAILLSPEPHRTVEWQVGGTEEAERAAQTS